MADARSPGQCIPAMALFGKARFMALGGELDLDRAAHSVGTARRIDRLGRVVVPAELRKMMGIHESELLDFRFVDGHIEILRVVPECVLCGATEELTTVRDKHLCERCLKSVRHQPECAICGNLTRLVQRNEKFVCSDCLAQMSVA
jgi:transcriptional pleiotropic regulator of transition state genes